MKKRKGFTMVELLATIAIIAVLTTLAIVGVKMVRNALKNGYYNRMKKLVIAAGIDYYNDHKGERPIRIGQSNKVALASLQDEDYIEIVKDYAKEVCDPNNGEVDTDKSYVVITKKSEKKYNYETYLNCPNYRDGTPHDTDTDPDVGPGGTDCTNMLTTNASGSGWSNTSVNLTATKPSNIASYEIQKQSGNGWITIGSTYTGNKTITVSDNGTSTYHVVGKGTDGSYCTSNTVEVKIDKDKPECGTPSGASTSWIKGSRTITQPCTDTGGSGCVKDSYEQTFSNTKLGTITIADNAGNTTNCSVNVYSDGAAPTCGTVSGASTSWLKGSRTITQACNDTGGSGCVKSSYAQTFSNTKVGTITIADNAGNTKDCSVNAYTDTTAPTCGTVTGASTTYVTTQRTIKVACSDSGSGCVKNPYEKTFYPTSSNQTTANIAIADNVGNSRNCSVNVYIKACGAPSLSGSIHTGKECPCKSSETLTNNKRADFTIGGCTKNSSGTTKISGYVCYYNTSSTSTGWSSDQKRHNKIVELGCETAKCTYKSGWHGSCNGSNHGCFTSATKWYLNRSTECSYIKVTGPGGTNEMTCNMSTKKCVTGVSNMIKNC